MWSCAYARARAAGRSFAKHCQPFDRKSHSRDWLTRPQSGHSPSPGSLWPCRGSVLHFALDPWSARTLTSLRAVEFAGDQLTVPGQDGVRPGDACHLGESLAAQVMTNLAEGSSIGVREHEAT